jgi:hypothetical protein
MKSLLQNDASKTSKPNNRQLASSQFASNQKLMGEFTPSQYDARQYNDALIEVDEMQIDKLYQSL